MTHTSGRTIPRPTAAFGLLNSVAAAVVGLGGGGEETVSDVM
jgi:hypothetical protein